MKLIAIALILFVLVQGTLRPEIFPPARLGTHLEHPSQAPWLAVVGDSSVTGAAAHPDFEASWESLLGHVAALVLQDVPSVHLQPRLEALPSDLDMRGPLRPVTRVLYSPRELTDARLEHRWVRLQWEAKAAIRLDTEEYSFGYFIGRKMGLPAERIVVVGQDGASLAAFPAQVERVMSVGTPTLPPKMLISYVANDLCDPEVFENPVPRFASIYRTNVREALRALRRYPAHAEGTQVVWVPPLEVANILDNQALLTQPVRLQEVTTTCADLREARAANGWAARWLQRVLIHECPAVLVGDDDGSQALKAQRLSTLRALQAAQREVLKQELGAFAKEPALGLHVTLASSMQDVRFQAGDLANDCFHPSARGHARISDQLLRHEIKGWLPAEPLGQK